MSEIVIAGAVRTPIGSFNGSLSSVPAHYLGQTVIAEAMRRANVDAEEVSEVIMGQILDAARARTRPARRRSVPAFRPRPPPIGINMVCGSGLRTVALGYQAIRTGDSPIVVAGGQESMSQPTALQPSAQRRQDGRRSISSTP